MIHVWNFAYRIIIIQYTYDHSLVCIPDPGGPEEPELLPVCPAAGPDWGYSGVLSSTQGTVLNQCSCNQGNLDVRWKYSKYTPTGVLAPCKIHIQGRKGEWNCMGFNPGYLQSLVQSLQETFPEDIPRPKTAVRDRRDKRRVTLSLILFWTILDDQVSRYRSLFV